MLSLHYCELVRIINLLPHCTHTIKLYDHGDSRQTEAEYTSQWKMASYAVI
jgi:hypothetical protein